MKAMIFAAGLGTRLKPFTLQHPKALAPINGVPVLEKNITYLQSFGINEFVINVHHFADQIIDFLAQKDNFGAIIHLSHERERALETGGGLLKAKSYLDKDHFVVMNADILTDMDLHQLIQVHQESASLATLAVSDRESSRKLHFDQNMRLKGWQNNLSTEHKGTITGTTALSFSGVQVISPAIFDLITETGAFSIMQPYLRLMRTQQIKGYDHTGAKWIDIGKPENLAKAQFF